MTGYGEDCLIFITQIHNHYQLWRLAENFYVLEHNPHIIYILKIYQESGEKNTWIIQYYLHTILSTNHYHIKKRKNEDFKYGYHQDHQK